MRNSVQELDMLTSRRAAQGAERLASGWRSLEGKFGQPEGVFEPRLWSEILAATPVGTELVLRLAWSGSAGSLLISASMSMLATIGGSTSTSSEALDGALERLLAFAYPGALVQPINVPEATDLRWRRLVPRTDQISVSRRLAPGALNEDLKDLPLTCLRAGGALDIDAAMAAFPPTTPWAIQLHLRADSLDGRVLRALDCLRSHANALLMREAGAVSEKVRDLLDFVGDLSERERILRLEAYVGTSGAHDHLAEGLATLALFGAPQAEDPVSTGRPDLRALCRTEPTPEMLLPTPQAIKRLSHHAAKRVSEDEPGGLVLGRSGSGSILRLSASDRARHLYVIGGTGSGKSTLLLNLLRQDLDRGEGIVLIDPHGDLAEDALGLARRRRWSDVIYCDAADPNGEFALNILRGTGPDDHTRRSFVASALIRIFTRVMWAEIPEAFGPMFELYFRNTLLLLMEGGGADASLLDFEAVLCNREFRALLLERCTDRNVIQFWRSIATKVTSGDHSLGNITPYISSKVAHFTNSPLMRRALCSPAKGIDFVDAMNGGAVVIVRLPRGLLGQSESELLAALTVMKLTQASMARAAHSQSTRRPVRLYIDEFQACAGDGIADLLAESRKYGVSMVLANQSLAQVSGRGHKPDTGAAALANAANLISFRVGAPDAARLAPWFAPDVDWQELCRLPDFQAMVRVLQHSAPMPAVQLLMAPPP